MTRGLTILLVTAIAGCTLLTGCASSSSSSGNSGSSGNSSSSSNSTSTPVATTAAGQATLAACEKNIIPTLSASQKAKLAAACQKAAYPDAATLKVVACYKQVNSSGVPAGPTRDAALAACNKLGSGGG